MMASKGQRYNEMTEKFKALAHPARLRIMANLMDRKCCVGEMQKCLSLPQPNVSQHLRILKKAGIIVGKREKNKICYEIYDNRIIKILETFDIGE
jgi:DNA-binding transcriptional ArsR family regulator